MDYPAAAFPDDKAKVRDYLLGIRRALLTGDLSKGPFETMVKSGEVYYTGNPMYEGPFFIHDSKPRNIMVPKGVGYRIHAAI